MPAGRFGAARLIGPVIVPLTVAKVLRGRVAACRRFSRRPLLCFEVSAGGTLSMGWAGGTGGGEYGATLAYGAPTKTTSGFDCLGSSFISSLTSIFIFASPLTLCNAHSYNHASRTADPECSPYKRHHTSRSYAYRKCASVLLSAG